MISRAILTITEAADRGRHRDYAVAQSAGGWRIQVQLDQRRPGGHGVTKWIQNRANELLRGGNAGVKRIPYDRPCGDDAAETISLGPMWNDLKNVIDMDAIRSAGIAIGVDPLGGAAVHYWEPMRRTTDST